MDDMLQQAEFLKIRQSMVKERLGLTKQAVNVWWGNFAKVPRKHIPALEEMGFRFPGRQYGLAAGHGVQPSISIDAATRAEAQALVDEVVEEIKTPEQRTIYLGLVNDVADVLARLRKVGQQNRIRLYLQKQLPFGGADSKRRS